MFALLTLLLCASALALPSDKPFYDLKDAEHHFEKFIQHYNRLYANDDEKLMRFEMFKLTLEEINKRNTMKHEHATYDINNFADMTRKERKSYTGLLPTTVECKLLLNDEQASRISKELPPTPCEKLVLGDEWSDFTSDSVPESFDWRDKNAVSEVKNQWGCGSCWTFSTTGNIEGQYAIKHGKIVTFSEQQLIDCNKVNNGCNGGLLNISFGDLLANGGIMTEQDYPYKAKEENCKFDASKAAAKLTYCYSLDLQNEEKLKAYLYKTGPLSIAISAGHITNYNHGVMRECGATDINHAVLLVGWGTEDGIPYWTIKNSWGAHWGDKGYVKIERGKNMCDLMNPCAGTAVLI